MSQPPFVVEALDGRHDRRSFTCGVPVLDHYLQAQAGQDVKRRVATCFVLRDRESSAVGGFYTLAASNIQLAELPLAVRKLLLRYPLVPAILLGRLAVASAYRGHGLGQTLLADALSRSVRSEIGAFAVLVDAKDEAAARFYARHGFVALAERDRRLFLPIATAMAGETLSIAIER